MRLNLAKHRHKKGLTQAELAAAAGIGQNSVSRIEAGRQQPKYETLQKLADVLEVEVIDLLADVSRSDLDRELDQHLEQMSVEEKRATLAYIAILRTQSGGAP